MKDFSNREKVIVMLCTLAALLSVLALSGQIRLSNRIDNTVLTGETASITINWFEEEPQEQESSASSEADGVKQGKRYIVNTSSKKIHSPDCQYAADIRDENCSEIYTDDLTEYLDKGYTICSKCNAE